MAGTYTSTSGKKPKRRRMKKLRLDEIAWVDHPAQEPARMAILKREDPQLRKFLDEFQNPRMTTAADGHQHLLDDDPSKKAGMTTHEKSEGEEFGHDHSWVRMDDGSIQITMSEGHGHELMGADEDLNKAAGEGSPADSTSKGIDTGGDDRDDSNMTKQNDPAPEPKDGVSQEQFEAMEKRAERAESVATLPQDQRSHFDGLDQEGQDQFLAKSSQERESIMKNLADANPVVYTAEDGTEFRKNDDQRLVQMAKDRDQDRAELTKERERRENAEFEKRASTELKHLRGSDEDKAALLKAVESLPEEQREKVSEILKSQDAGISKALTTMGVKGNDPEGSSPEDRLDAMAKKRASEKSISFEKAYREVLESDEGQSIQNEQYEVYAESTSGR